jgi:hypothetical protein
MSNLNMWLSGSNTAFAVHHLALGNTATAALGFAAAALCLAASLLARKGEQS